MLCQHLQLAIFLVLLFFHFFFEFHSRLVPCFLVQLSMKELPQTPSKSSRNGKPRIVEVGKKGISLDKEKISTDEHPVPDLAL